MRIALVASLFVAAAGCAGSIPLPMTAGRLVSYDSPDALVAYLGQPDASGEVCDLRAQGPHLTALPPDMRLAIVHGLESGKIAPTVWRSCVDAALDSVPADQASSLLDDVMLSYQRMVSDGNLAASPTRAAAVGAEQRAYLDRRAGLEGHAKVIAPIIADLRGKLAKKKLDATAASFASEVVANDDVEHGMWQGQRVDLALLDKLADDGNELTLTRFAQRLPDPALREQAMRRIVRVHIALSPFDEVRAAAQAVEDLVVKTGENRVALADHAPQRAYFDETKVPIRNVLVRQDVWHQTATLLGYAQQRPKLSVLPELSFRNSLWVDLDGISRSVTLCAPAKALDPSPCIDVTDARVDNPLAYLDRGGAFHFRDDIAESDVLPLATVSDFVLPVSLAGKPAVSLHWGLYFAQPDNLSFVGDDLNVRVERPAGTRYVFTLDSSSGRYTAVVEASDLATYRIASIGASGSSGSDGLPGSDGTSGGECQDGGPGGNGSDGGPGGDGGDGGNIHVTLAGAASSFDVPTLERIIYSAGGSGGPGGRGGAGGNGGAGGSSRSPTTHTDSDGNTVTDDPGCSAGSNGSSGSSGMDGSSGSDGRPGQVTFTVAR